MTPQVAVAWAKFEAKLAKYDAKPDPTSPVGQHLAALRAKGSPPPRLAWTLRTEDGRSRGPGRGWWQTPTTKETTRFYVNEAATTAALNKLRRLDEHAVACGRCARSSPPWHCCGWPTG